VATLGAGRVAVTPGLLGRWQTRLVLLATLGVVVAGIFALARGDEAFFIVLAFVAILGLVWDLIYMAIQQVRWDRDWPTAFQVAAGIVEGVVVFLVLEFIGLPDIDKGAVGIGIYAAHYGITWLVVFLCTQGPMRVLAPRWRYNGGRLA